MAGVASIALRASPNGSTAGFTVLSDGTNSGAVAIVVLPKSWSRSPGRVRSATHQPGATTHLVLYELDTAEIVTDIGAAQALALSVTSLPIEAGNEEDGVGRRLLESVPISGAAVIETAPENLHEALLSMLLIIERSHALRGHLSMQGHYLRSLLRLLEQLRFVDEVERVIYLARPIYEERQEELTIPRGRVIERALLRSQWSGIPRAESVFDDLTTNTPVLQIAAAALRVTVATQHGRQLRSIARGLRHRSLRLLQLLSGVTVLDPPSALLQAERSRLGRLDEAWIPTIAAAMPVLRGHGVAPEQGRDQVQRALVLSLPMEQAWEEWLERALRIVWEEVRSQARTRAPWALDASRPPESARIDFLVRLSDKRIAVMDAKYKLDSGFVRSSDAYQLFAYSHLAQMDGRSPSVAVLLYPQTANGEGRPVVSRYQRVPDTSFSLFTAQLPFPSAAELRAPEPFTDYLTRLVGDLKAASSDWM